MSFRNSYFWALGCWEIIIKNSTFSSVLSLAKNFIIYFIFILLNFWSWKNRIEKFKEGSFEKSFKIPYFCPCSPWKYSQHSPILSRILPTNLHNNCPWSPCKINLIVLWVLATKLLKKLFISHWVLKKLFIIQRFLVLNLLKKKNKKKIHNNCPWSPRTTKFRNPCFLAIGCWEIIIKISIFNSL